MAGLEALTRDECWERLRGGTVGHLVYTRRAMPMIRPMPYVVTGQHLLVAAPSDELAGHVDGQVVAFEVDALDETARCGWSVVALGTARRVRDAGEVARVSAYSLASWSGIEHPSRLRLTVGELTGRLLVPAQPVATA